MNNKKIKLDKNEKLGWKVCNEIDHDYIFSSSFGCVKYKINEWTFPKKNWGPLAVFETREAARDFRRILDPCYNDIMCIYRCKYVPSYSNYQYDNIGSVKDLCDMPDGKALAKKVMLLYKA